MNRKITQKQALRSALASSRMEGFQITPKIEADTKMILSGKTSIEEYIKQIKRENESLRRVN